jgi:hypothetical protein
MTVLYEKLVREFLTETLEALAYIYVILIITEKTVEWKLVLKVSVFLGIVQTVLMYVDEEARLKVKDGMKSTIGQSAVMRVVR